MFTNHNHKYKKELKENRQNRHKLIGTQQQKYVELQKIDSSSIYERPSDRSNCDA